MRLPRRRGRVASGCRMMVMVMMRGRCALGEGGTEGLQPRLRGLNLPQHGAELGTESWRRFRGNAALISERGRDCRADRLNHANVLAKGESETERRRLSICIVTVQ